MERLQRQSKLLLSIITFLLWARLLDASNDDNLHQDVCEGDANTCKVDRQDATRLTVFDWNILAPIWIGQKKYNRTGDKNLLHEGKRLLLVIHRIRQSDADVVTLQEVQRDQYDTIESELSDKYDSLGLTTHEPSYWNSAWLADDKEPQENGQATFIRKGLFTILEKRTIQTTDDGNRLQIAVLQLIARDGNEHVIQLINLHLESGTEDWKHGARKKQVLKIHEEISKVISQFPKPQPMPILVGDFNMFGNQPGMQELRKLNYVDAAEMMGIVAPTAVNDRRQITLDHMVLRKQDVESGKIEVMNIKVPNASSDEYGPENHKGVIFDALRDRLQRNGMTLEEGLLNSDEALEIVSHILPSPSDYTETLALKSLRVGSDHLPLFVDLQLNSV